MVLDGGPQIVPVGLGLRSLKEGRWTGFGTVFSTSLGEEVGAQALPGHSLSASSAEHGYDGRMSRYRSCVL